VNKNQLELTGFALNKATDSIKLVEASLKKFKTYEKDKIYSPDELEPYDALSDRFIRSVEICIKFFKSYELYHYGVNSDTVRDLLNQMAKLKLISSTLTWMQMRDVRNRIVHDYLPDQIYDIYELSNNIYGKELKMLKSKLLKIKFQS